MLWRKKNFYKKVEFWLKISTAVHLQGICKIHPALFFTLVKKLDSYDISIKNILQKMCSGEKSCLSSPMIKMDQDLHLLMHSFFLVPYGTEFGTKSHLESFRYPQGTEKILTRYNESFGTIV